MDYLKDKQHYIDRYDLQTIKECLDWYWSLKKGMEARRGEIKTLTDEEFKKDTHKAVSYTINVLKGERYRHKEKTINEWIERDRIMQEKYDNTSPPADMRCKECYSETTVTLKHIENSYTDNPRMLFTFGCIKCKKRQVIYEDGKEWVYKAPRCPKCGASLNNQVNHRRKDVLIFISTCSNCSYYHKDVDDFKKSQKEREEREAREMKLLAEYRKDFVYSDEEGKKYIYQMDNIKAFIDRQKENEKKDKDPVYQKARQLKKLKVNQLKELLVKAIVKVGYEDLQFGKPEMGQFIIIDFSVNDIKNERKERDSENALKKLIKNILDDTNWRLMTDGVQYRLGILTGRLKAYEQEEDLVKLIKSV